MLDNINTYVYEEEISVDIILKIPSAYNKIKKWIIK